MVTDEVDYVVGVDTHRDEHVVAVLTAPAGAVVAKQAVGAERRGYREALCLAERYAPGARAWAIEGAGHYGAGLARYLRERGEAVLEVSCTPRAEAGCAARMTRSTRSEQRGQRLPAKRSRCRAPGSGARRCGCC
jgi:hypothetical protein